MVKRGFQMSNQQSAEQIFTEQELADICRARSVRMAVVQGITSEKDYLDDNDRITILLKAVDGLDKSAVGSAKLRIASKSANNTQSQMAALLAAMNVSQFMPVPVSSDKKEAKLDFVINDLKPGEADIGIKPLGLEDLALNKKS